MKWFKRWFRNMCKEAWHDAQKEEMDAAPRLVSSDDSRTSPRQDGLNFVLYKAVGGHILESRQYNHRTDRNEGTLYMIHEDEDFAKQVAQAIMMEQMKG